MSYEQIFKNKKQPLAKRRLAFLNDTLEYYSTDVSRRNIDDDRNCLYSPLNKNSDGCAIGRFMKKTDSAFLDKNKIGSIITVFNKYPERIPLWMKSLGIDFLNVIQLLHDENDYWNEKGLSPDGKIRVDTIKRIYIENE